MPREVFQKTVTRDDPHILCDALCRLSGLSKVKVKDAMTKGAAWVRKSGGRKRRVHRAKAAIRPGDSIWLYYDPYILEKCAPQAYCMLDRTEYSIWYKPAGLMSQGSPFGDHCALPRQIEEHFSPRRAVHLVHRLDREVPGLIIVAHGKNAAARFSKMLRENWIEKRYKAVLKGDLRSYASRGEISLPLDGRPAVTVFDVISYDEERDISTAGIEIRTGRLHQIRRHFEQIGHPVMGDPRYGRNNSDPEGLQLTADALSFDCPLGGGRIRVSSTHQIHNPLSTETATAAPMLDKPLSETHVKQTKTCKGDAMQREILNIPNISCGHCVAAIENELKDISGVHEVSGNPDTKQVTVQWDSPATLEIIRKALEEINYPAS